MGLREAGDAQLVCAVTRWKGGGAAAALRKACWHVPSCRTCSVHQFSTHCASRQLPGDNKDV
jgi:hypothetical protein